MSTPIPSTDQIAGHQLDPDREYLLTHMCGEWAAYRVRLGGNLIWCGSTSITLDEPFDDDGGDDEDEDEPPDTC